jgi:(p)ppGpp synthase/HD superfamily hydrolase
VTAEPRLGPRFREALLLAADAHQAQRRKGTDIPYVSHLLAVAALVLEAGGDEDQAIAALLHDGLEDQPDHVSRRLLTDRFGSEVTRIVVACSDTEQQPKPPWRPRKEAYLAHLKEQDDRVLLVSLADKLHNATSLRRDLECEGASVWRRFNAGPADQLWYHASLAAVFLDRLGAGPAGPLARDYVTTVERITELTIDS